MAGQRDGVDAGVRKTPLHCHVVCLHAENEREKEREREREREGVEQSTDPEQIPASPSSIGFHRVHSLVSPLCFKRACKGVAYWVLIE